MGASSRLAHPKSTLQSVTMHDALPARRTAIAALFVACHALAVSYAVSTAGQPYLAALAQQAKLDNLTNSSGNATAAVDMDTASLAFGFASTEPEPPSQPPAVTAAKKPASTSGSSGGSFGDEAWDDSWDDDIEFGAAGGAAPTGAAPSVTVEGGGANASSSGNTTKTERPLPHEWLPSALACALLFLSVTANCLFYLLCHWSTSFKARALFAPSTSLAVGKYLHFVPLPHKGKPALVRLSSNPQTGMLMCEYQRQRFEVLSLEEAMRSAAKSEPELTATDGAQWAVRLTRCPTELRHDEYASSAGLEDEAALKAAVDKYGVNVISVPTPRFVDLYVEQLLSPLVIFQLFTSALWLLDAVSIGFTIFQVTTRECVLDAGSVLDARWIRAG